MNFRQTTTSQAVVEMASLGQVADAVDHLEQAVRLSPSHAGAWYQLGLACEQIGKEERAEQAFKAAVAIDRDFAAAHESLGLLLYSRGDMKAAKKSFKELSRIADIGRVQTSPVSKLASFAAALLCALMGAVTSI